MVRYAANSKCHPNLLLLYLLAACPAWRNDLLRLFLLHCMMWCTPAGGTRQHCVQSAAAAAWRHAGQSTKRRRRRCHEAHDTSAAAAVHL